MKYLKLCWSQLHSLLNSIEIQDLTALKNVWISDKANRQNPFVTIKKLIPEPKLQTCWIIPSPRPRWIGDVKWITRLLLKNIKLSCLQSILVPVHNTETEENLIQSSGPTVVVNFFNKTKYCGATFSPLIWLDWPNCPLNNWF